MQLARNVRLRLPTGPRLPQLGQRRLHLLRLSRHHLHRRLSRPAAATQHGDNHGRFSKSVWCGYAGYANAKSASACYGGAAGSYAHADSADIWRTGQHNA